MNLLFGTPPNTVAETGLKINSKGQITFARGQTFPGGGAGSVTSVGLSAPISDFSVSNSPVTGSGTLTLQWLVQPTALAASGAIVKRDNTGSFTANGIVLGELGLQARSSGEGVGAVSTANRPNTPAVSGRAAATGDGTTNGVNGFSSTNQGAGVFGFSDGTAGAGLQGENVSTGFGAVGQVFGSSGVGVVGKANGASGQGVLGESFGTVVGPNGFGPDGVDGISHADGGAGVAAVNTAGGDALFAQSNTGAAGFFLGNVEVHGSLSKAGGSFKIDHPLDPANKYLYHSFVESPDMMNI